MRESPTAIERQIVRAMPGGVVISVHVQPRASQYRVRRHLRPCFEDSRGGPPGGRSGERRIVRFFARHCDVPLSAIQILEWGGEQAETRAL